MIPRKLVPYQADGAHANIKDIRPFLKYFNNLVTTEVYNDVLFISEKNEKVWWYDSERIAFHTPNYTKILNVMRTYPTLTLADMKEITGISIAAIQELLDKLIQKNMLNVKRRMVAGECLWCSELTIVRKSASNSFK